MKQKWRLVYLEKNSLTIALERKQNQVLLQNDVLHATFLEV